MNKRSTTSGKRRPVRQRHRVGDDVSVGVNDIPLLVKRALVKRTRAEGTNMNAVAVAIVADRFGMPYEGSTRKYPAASDSTDMVLVMPRALRMRLRVEAAQRESSVRDLIVSALAEALA